MASIQDKIDRIEEILGMSQPSPVEVVIVDKIYLGQPVSSELCAEYGLLLERRDQFSRIPGTKYEYRIDPPRGIPGPGNLRHVHIYDNGDHLFAMNIDGTAHDGCHQVCIPEEVAAFLRKKGFTIPKGNLIEMVLPAFGGRQLLCD